MAALLSVHEPADTTVTIQGVEVRGMARQRQQMKTSQNSVSVGRDYLEQNFSGSLMQTLQGIPGVKAMSIGSGLSKPTIRGLGFNRMAVTEDGVKHEGQQWGDDHGLEIDQFAVDRAEVVKGPAALLYGSDAIGGVLNLFTNHIPVKPFEGTVQLNGRSNNESVGLSAKVGGRQDAFFYRAHVTFLDYADYKVPTDSIQYYSYWIRLKDGRLRNTAGCERDGSLMLGYAGYNFHTDVRVSDSYSKSGFFADAHGLEVRLSTIDYDRSRRDVDLPRQWVNHLKVLSHTSWTEEKGAMELNLAYQNNLREERSEPVSHGYMPKPESSLERRFRKDTYSGQLVLRRSLGDRHELQTGVSTEFQHNRRSGWGFIIPDFETLSMGAYVFDRYTLREGLIVNAGLRYDHARSHIHEYHDWYQTPVAPVQHAATPSQPASSQEYRQRSADAVRRFNSLTWSAGVNWLTGDWVLKANVGKSFRVPIPKELGADGVNYHIFRYEQGNADLSPEESYQIDAGVSWSHEGWNLQVEPYVNYFPNYIYLNPTSQFVEGLQLYYYTQAEVLRYGFEAELGYELNRHWQLSLKGEYLYAEQLSGDKIGYSLPFSTPWSVDADVRYSFFGRGTGFVGLNGHLVGRQDHVVPPERPTDGFFTLNIAAGQRFPLTKGTTMKVALHADNLLNRRYYDHTSYYRLIDVPEPGINCSLMVGLDF
jgi:iron complex outermembrane receptor protein